MKCIKNPSGLKDKLKISFVFITKLSVCSVMLQNNKSFLQKEIQIISIMHHTLNYSNTNNNLIYTKSIFKIEIPRNHIKYN